MDHTCFVRVAWTLLTLGLASDVFAQQHRADLAFQPDSLRDMRPGEHISLPAVPLPGVGGEVTLDLTRFEVTHSGTQFVVGNRDGNDRPLTFDPRSVVLLRGDVQGIAGSHAFVTLSDRGLFGTFQTGRGETFVITSRIDAVSWMPEGQATVLPNHGEGGLALPCGTDGLPAAEPSFHRLGGEPRPGLFQVELAVDTDYELYEQFFDLDDEAAHIVQIYGAISDIYLRDVGTSVVLTYVRLWDDSADLFNVANPLYEFRSYWNSNMGHVHRDAAQFLSGRVNLPYGGIAWLSSVCTGTAYSVSGYTLGYLSSLEQPSAYLRDIRIPAHELGHNLGMNHTPNYGIDECDDPKTPAQRGPIMSYCGQTHSGGGANYDLRFHVLTAAAAREHLADATNCIVVDCNLNGIADDIDISTSASEDLNANGIPDECEDCNGNGVLDTEDIASGSSDDVNNNGRPDDCEPDCNGNGFPDDYDIDMGTSEDAYGDGRPDECEPDCNNNGVSDITEINLDMSLDLDRDVRLDSCEDCDADGTTDLDQLDGAGNVWIADMQRASLREFLSVTGTVVSDSDDGSLSSPSDVIILPDLRVLVASTGDDRIVEFDYTGALVGTLVSTGAGGLDAPGAMLVGPSGTLLVASTDTNSVKAFDLSTGASLGDLVSPDAGGLTAPFGLALSASGTLLVTSGDNRVLEYDASTGAFIREFVSAADNGDLSDPRGLLVLPSTNVLVASRGSNAVLEFDGTTGAFVRQFNRGGTADRLSMDEPWCLRLGADGDVYVSRSHEHDHLTPGRRPTDDFGLHLTNARIYQFDVDSGKLVRSYVQSLDSGIELPTGFDFIPGDGMDCNRNLVPDVCDIASGTSLDDNGDGVPDECQEFCIADWNSDAILNTADFVAYLNDFNLVRTGGTPTYGDPDLAAPFGSMSTADFLEFLNLYALGCDD